MKKALIVTGIVVFTGIVWATYLYHKPKIATDDMKTEYVISSVQIAAAYESDENDANEKYLGKYIEVYGRVVNVESEEFYVLTLQGKGMSNVRAQMVENIEIKSGLQGQSVTLKGKCTGVLLDVILNDCIILKD